MKAISNFKSNTSSSQAREMLPVGNYPGKILGAKVESGQWGETLVVQVEITEGQYKDFFRKDYDAQKDSQYGQKYRGVMRVNLPSGDGSEFDGYRVKALERIAGALELSNPGYTWDWDEKKLKGKAAGLMVREHSKVFDDGNEASWTEVASLCDVARVNEIKTLKPKHDGPKKETATTAAAPAMEASDDDDLPF